MTIVESLSFIFVTMDEEVKELIIRRRKQILVHSYIYYELNESLIDDYTWSEWAKELYDLQTHYPEESKNTFLYEEFKDFDYSTGAGLDYFKPWVISKAKMLLDYVKRRKE